MTDLGAAVSPKCSAWRCVCCVTLLGIACRSSRTLRPSLPFSATDGVW